MDSLQDLLAIYLNDHLVGATAGANLAHRLAQAEGGEVGAELARLDREIAEDRDDLLHMMSELGLEARRYKVALGWMAEKAGRLKSNGHLVRRSPLSTVLELETLRMGVLGKLSGWKALEAAVTDPPLVAKLQRLRGRAEEQLATLADLHRRVAHDVFAADASPVRAAG